MRRFFPIACGVGIIFDILLSTTFLILFVMQKHFKSEKKHYEVPALEWTFVNVEAGFAYSGDKDASTSKFVIDDTQDSEDAWE